ncbi:MAG: NYN domain-containing protein [Gemmatimonadaceae bacterium]
MHNRYSRSTPQTSRPAVAPFHRGPSAQPLNAAPATVAPNHGAAQNAPNAAMLIDFDNVTMGIQKDLHAELKNLLSSDIIKGKVAVRRAYADWRRYPGYIVPLTESSIDLIFAPAYGTAKKNATDIRLAIDAMELVFTRPEIGTFVLLSGDSDFSSMVIKLKEYGKYVIGVGIRESASDLLVMNCDEYYSYNALAGLVKTGDDESTRWDPYELVTEAITRMKRDGDVMRSDRLKQVMQDIDASFNEKDLGKSKFSQFVQDAAHKGLLRTTKLENGQLEVDVPLNDGTTPLAATAASASTAAVDGDAVIEPARRDRAERDDRRGRRGRRGRGGPVRDRDSRDGDEAPHTGTTGEFPTTEVAAVTAAPVARPISPAVSPVAQFKPSFTPATSSASVASAPVAPSTTSFADTIHDTIGRGGERLTRVEAFDLVRRAVEALVKGEETTTASAVRQRAYELLGRDSESLSGRNFERILRDSHDADMIDLRRRGNDFEVARAADAAPIVEQLKSAEQAHKAQAAANAPPPAPRGMAHRGVGGRAKGGRGGPAPISADMLMVGVVGAPKVAALPVAPKVVAPPVTPIVAAPVPVATPAAALETPAIKGAKRGAPAAKSAPAKTAKATKPAAKVPAKKAVAKTAPAVAEAKPVAKKAAAPAKPAAKKASKTARK